MTGNQSEIYFRKIDDVILRQSVRMGANSVYFREFGVIIMYFRLFQKKVGYSIL